MRKGSTQIPSTFSPLHSGQATAIRQFIFCDLSRYTFQSPPFGASHCNYFPCSQPSRRLHLSVPSIRGKPLQCQDQAQRALRQRVFQSPPFGASHCNGKGDQVDSAELPLSVPSIRGKPLQLTIP